MTVDYRDGISILELIFYVPALFVAVWMACRHGFAKSSGWLSFILFSLARIVGSCCGLATISNPNNIGLYIAYAVCNAVGVGPLLIACTGLLSRINNSIHRKTSRPLNPIIFRALGLLTVCALVLTIVGQTIDPSLETLAHPKVETKAGIIIFLATWVATCLVLLALRARYDDIEDGEHRLLLAVGISLPFLLVRLIYSIIYIFAHSLQFNIVTGNVTIMLVMAVLEEFAIVVICLGTGLTLQVRPPVPDLERSRGEYQEYQEYRSPSETRQPKSSEPQYQSHAAEADHVPRRQRRHRRGGPITQLVMLAADEISAARDNRRRG